jgi:hypothetical protein
VKDSLQAVGNGRAEGGKDDGIGLFFGFLLGENGRDGEDKREKKKKCPSG